MRPARVSRIRNTLHVPPAPPQPIAVPAEPPARPSGRGFAERLTPLLASAGVTALPTLLLRYQSLLDLSPQAVVLVAWVLSKKWSAEWPYLSLDEVASGVGRDRAVVKSWKRELVRKGFLKTSPRYLAGVGRRADTWDLSGLFAQLERLYLREQSQAALDKVRTDLPPPAYGDALGLSPVPTPSTGRRGKITPPHRGEHTPSVEGDFASSPGMKSPRLARRKPPPEEEPGLADTTRETHSGEPVPREPAHDYGPASTLSEAQRRGLIERLLRDHPEDAEHLHHMEERLRRRVGG
jgi:hypothetical protein